MWLGMFEGDVITEEDVITKCGRRGNRTLNLTVTRVKIGRFADAANKYAITSLVITSPSTSLSHTDES